MTRKTVLKIALTVVGLLFVAPVYPMLRYHLDPTDQMLGAIYGTLGIFLLLALRNPSASRSLIAFAGWSSLAHSAIMALQVYQAAIPRADLFRAVLPFGLIGIVLVALTPGKSTPLTP